MSRVTTLFLSLGICFLSSCNKAVTEPEFIPILVTGKVLETNGSPVKDGMVMLRSVPNGEHGASGKLENGTFKLFTIVGNEKVEGIPAGKYRVTFARFSTNQADLPVDLKANYEIKPDQSDLEIKLE
ncbi:MAG: hypothetical protein JWM11_8093 [Planctomycetaceae bacterium]|nr:hypothetical protein [Planctomycetaceae bacterium]